MSFNTRIQESVGGAASATLNGTSHTTGGGVVGGNAIDTTVIEVGSLTAYVDATAKTNTMTLSGKWQVSHDSTTWYDVELLAASGIASSDTPRILATGTGSAVEYKGVLPAPRAAYGWRYARVCIVVGVADSADASDAWAYNYNYLLSRDVRE